MTQSLFSRPNPSMTVSSMMGSGLPTFTSYFDPVHASIAPTTVAASGSPRPPRKRAVTVQVRRDERCPPVEPDGVEGDLELAVVEAAVVGGYDYVDLLGPLGRLYAGRAQGILQRLLGYGEDGRVRVAPEEPAGHGDHG